MAVASRRPQGLIWKRMSCNRGCQSHRFAIAAALTLLASPTEAHGQMSVVGECASLTPIEMTREISIPDRGPGHLGPAVSYATDSPGRVWAARHDSSTVIGVFASSGLLEADLDARGPRTGEFRTVVGIVVAAGDSAHVFDAESLTHTVFSPSLELVRQVELPEVPFHNSMARLPSGRWVIGANIATRDRVGLPLHVLNSAGNLEASFGAVDPVYRMDARNMLFRVVAPAGEDRVWTGHRTQYRIELWDTSNTLHRTLTRSLAWFEPWVRDVATTPDIPRNPYVRDLSVDDTGRLWVLISRASENFGDHVAADGDGGYYWTSDSGYWASVVEVIDPAMSCVAARLETEVYLEKSLGNGRYAGYEERNGAGHLDIWQLRYSPGSQRRR